MVNKSTLWTLALVAPLLMPASGHAEPGFGLGFLPHRAPVARAQAAEGELPLQRVIAIAEKAGRGEYLNANRDGRDAYRVKVIRPDGVVVHVFVDARSGEVLGIRDR